VSEVPITFRDRRVGQSKMSRRIVVEALLVVVALRTEELANRLPWRRRTRRSEGPALAGGSSVLGAGASAAKTPAAADPVVSEGR
jgi:hypothetical protein